VKGATRIAQMAVHPKWGGGLHWDHIAALLGFHPNDERLKRAIWRARALGLIDVHHGWVIADKTAIDKRRAASARPVEPTAS
jgi:hypothetical protein